MKPKGWLSIFLLISTLSINAQKTSIYDEPQASYRLGLELFSKEKYSAAQDQFDRVVNSISDSESELKGNAEYYRAICALELENDNAEYLISNFISTYPTSSRIERSYFQLGRLQFRNRDYRNALESFTKVSRSALSKNERTEYNFKKGFCFLQKNEPENAKNLFSSVKDSKGEYAKAATYYYAHILYTEGKYDDALTEFNKLAGDRAYRKDIPYYIIHINYYKGDYDEILKSGPELYRTSDSKRKPGIARLIGDSYYRAGDYNQALDYLENYKRGTRHGLSREDNYQIGLTYYNNQRYDDAIHHFQSVIKEMDSLSQNAYYHLGDCYLKTDKKKYAHNAFLSAYKLDYDQKIKEDALFNHAKLSMEVAHDPYNESIKSLEQYITEYPNSDRIEEAYNLLVELFLSTRNYKAALESIEKIKNRNENLNKAYQKICYYRAIELFNNGDFNNAIELFKNATNNNYDREIAADANFWIGESFYRLKNYWGARKYYGDFLNASGTKNSSLRIRAYYNLGYTHYKRKDYNKAVESFKKFVRNPGGEDAKLVNDAYLRLGDCYFINKQYKTAIDYYNESLRLNQSDLDYALYKKAMAYGALGEFKSKVNALERIVNHHRGSPYTDKALYEIGITELILNDNRRALVFFDKLVKEHPNSNLATRSLLKTGLIYYNNDQYAEAVKALKKVVNNYPNTPESREALASLKNIYIDMNNVDEYFSYTENMPDAMVNTSEQDSITYIAAENQYMRNDCAAALPSFRKYIEKFPYGAFLLNVHYYKADCEMRRDSLEDALEDYAYVVGQPRSTYTENAYLNASRISERLAMYEEAYGYFKGLETNAENNTNINFALEGQMNNAFRTDNYQGAIEAARKLLRNNKVTNEQINEAHYVLAKSYFAQNNYNEAKSEFEITSKLSKNEKGAEAKYFQAYIEYENGNYTTAENLIFELADSFSSYDYWMAKSFILLADVYIKLDNVFQAKQTLQSIIDNYQGDDLREIAQMKLDELIEAEKSQESQEQNNNF